MIESEKSYSGETVKALLDAVYEEAAKQIKVAYDEGYKAGMLDSYPDGAYWESLAQSMKMAAEKSASAPGWGTVIGVSVGTMVVGFAAGVVVSAVYALNN